MSPAGNLKRKLQGAAYEKSPKRKLYNASPARVAARAARAKTPIGKLIQKRSAARWFVSSSGRTRTLKRLYNLTLEEWETMFNGQGRACAICKTLDPGHKWWCTDHDHKTKKVRGVLCHKCNAGIGLLQDSHAVLQNGIFYLLGMPT